jgi:hypothetical protein
MCNNKDKKMVTTTVAVVPSFNTSLQYPEDFIRMDDLVLLSPVRLQQLKTRLKLKPKSLATGFLRSDEDTTISDTASICKEWCKDHRKLYFQMKIGAKNMT